MTAGKILKTHLQRVAIVYARQSTLKQLHEHKESLLRQLALKERAIACGWAANEVVLIADDLGQSGASVDWRQGFQRLAEDVARGKVGAIFALEVSRLARSSADWHRLLELCSLADVLIADEQAIYSPRDYNDRLLLGLKGTMSEAELYWMRLRLEGGRLSKARRGELYFCPAAGYEWDRSTCRFRFDPDERVQRTIFLIFERFRLSGSAYVVTRYFAQAGLLLPVRDFQTRELKWVPASYTLIISILHNPIYAGTYVFGRTEQRMGLDNGKLKRRCYRRMPQEAWKSVIHDRHAAYISWEEFMANQKKLDDNRTFNWQGSRRGAAREGRSLLQGLILCGRCGRKMHTRYRGKNRLIHYRCRLTYKEVSPVCFTVSGEKIERAVEEQFLAAVIPKNIDLSLNLVRETEKQIKEIDIQWKLRIEQLQYECRLAERRYKAIDPDNRAVARTLEREWEEKLRELEDVTQEHEEVIRREKLELSGKDRAQLFRLAKDLRTVWHAETTKHSERKNLLRMLIRQVTLSPIQVPQKQIRIQIWWQTGATSEIVINRENRYTAQATEGSTIKLIQSLCEQGNSDEQIATELNNRQIRRKENKPWDIPAIQRRRYAFGFHRISPKSHKAPSRREDGLYSIHGVAEYFGVTQSNVRSWVQMGALLAKDGGGIGRARWFLLDELTIQRLKQLQAKRAYEEYGSMENFANAKGVL